MKRNQFIAAALYSPALFLCALLFSCGNDSDESDTPAPQPQVKTSDWLFFVLF